MSLQTTFNASLAQIFRQGLPQKIAVALSGGVDSMCLTHLLHNSKRMLNHNVEIYPIMINHNLRPNSRAEIPLVRSELTKLGLQNNFLTKELNFDELEGNSFEEMARLKRYNALQDLCQPLGIHHILLGHHLDDQLETFILRLLKNSGVFGLAGMSPVAKVPTVSPEKLKAVRPLLGVTKSEIIQYCKDNNVSWVEDHTNFEEVALRNVVRKWVKEHEDVKYESLQNFSKVKAFTHTVDSKASALKEAAEINSPAIGTITVKFTKDQLKNSSDLVVARMLFKVMYPISPSTNYHYSFNKLLASIPKLRASSDTSFTLLQLQWDLKPTESGVELTVSRQNPTTPVEYELTVPANGTSEDILFDNIYWIKIHNNSDASKSFTVKTLDKDDRGRFVSLPLDFKYSEMKNKPVVVENDKVLGFAQDLDFVECQIKENIYE